jgi:hypothetical protein
MEAVVVIMSPTAFKSEFRSPLTNFNIVSFVILPYLVQAVQLSSLHHATV